MISEIYPTALDCGISPERFWDLSLAEVTDLIESFQRCEESRIKHELRMKHFLARDIGQYTALAVQGSDNVHLLELWDYFPELFGDEKDAAEREIQERRLAVYKAQMEDFVHRHNRKNGGGK